MSWQPRSVTINSISDASDSAGGETDVVTLVAANVPCTRHYRNPGGAGQNVEAAAGTVRRTTTIYFFDVAPLPSVPNRGRIVDGSETWNIILVRTYDGMVQVDVELVQ